MFFCVNCGNNIKSSNKQFNTSARNYKTTGCPRWRYHVKCDYCNKINDYIKHKILFTPILSDEAWGNVHGHELLEEQLAGVGQVDASEVGAVVAVAALVDV